MKKNNKEYKLYRKNNKKWIGKFIKSIKQFKPFDWCDFFDFNVLTLEYFLDYYKKGNNVWQCDESRDKIIESLKNVLKIPKQIEEIDNLFEPEKFSEEYFLKQDAETAKLYELFFEKIGKEFRMWWD